MERNENRIPLLTKFAVLQNQFITLLFMHCNFTRFSPFPLCIPQTNLRDKLTPIKVDVEYGIYDPYPGNSRILKPILNMANKNIMSKQIHIEKNCGKDNRCIPDLRLSVRP